jgi:serine/threonine-protein kinase PknK
MMSVMAVANLVDSGQPQIEEVVPVLDGRYVAGKRLGRGASGETYTAQERTTGAACVVKLFDPATRAAATAEFRQLTELAHPSVVRVRDIGRAADGRLFLVTDLVAGAAIDSLATVLDETQRRRAFERAARDLADALAHLHGRGLIHGDVCPANVRFDDAGRAVLLDFGLAGRPRAGDGAARGTLGYAAPEALTGVCTAAGDLFALGATLFETWTGATPFGRGLPAVQRMLTGRAPPLSSVRGGLGEAWDRLVAQLLEPDPRGRPSSARTLLRDIFRATAGSDTPTEVDLGVPYPEGDPLEGILVGRAAEREALRSVMERLAEGSARRAVVTIVGPPGSGRRTLIEIAARDVAVAAAAGLLPDIEIWRGDLESLERFCQARAPLAGDADEARVLQQRFATLGEALESHARARPLCVLLTEGLTADAFASFWAGAPPSGRVLLVVPARAPQGRPFGEDIVLPPLTAADIGDLVTRALGDEAPPPAALADLVEAARGHAALAAALARRLVSELRAGGGAGLSAPEAVRSSFATPGADLESVLSQSLAALAADARLAAVAVALAGGRGLALMALSETAGERAVASARAAGWIRNAPTPADLEPPTEAHRRVALDALADPTLLGLARRAADALRKDDPRRADVMAAIGLTTEAAHHLRGLAAQLVGSDPGRAALWLERAAALDPGTLTVSDQLSLATGLGVLGRYPAASAALDTAATRALTPADHALCAERRAWLLARTGDLPAAAAALTAALTSVGTDPAAVPLRARLARLQVAGGRFRDALVTLEPLHALIAQPPLAIEAAVLAHAYQGELTAAHDQLRTPAGERGVKGARRAYLEALLAQLAGDGAAATDHYRRAYELSANLGEVHTLAAVALNLGALLAEQGLYGEALAATERAVRELGRLGATAELGTALVNAANLLLQLGDLGGARRALDRARVEARRQGAVLAEAMVSFVDGDLARREGQSAESAPFFRAAAARFLEVGQRRRAGSALLTAAEAFVECGQAAEATRALAEALPLVEAPDDDREVTQAKARLTLSGADVAESPAALAARAEVQARQARARGLRPAAWRLAAASARLHDRAGATERARQIQAFARNTFQEIRMATPEHHRAGLDTDPDTHWLTALGTPAPGDTALAARAAEIEGRLRRLLRINKRLNSEPRLPRLLETIVDTVIELTDAERGFLLLEDDAGALVVKVARNIDQKTLETTEFELSRSIARQAAAGGEPIVTIDAAGDTRFREALSVSDLHLRSVLAVPLAIKGRAVGTIYVDHRLRKGAFDQDDVKLVTDFAEQAAIAIENARLLTELRRRERQVEALNRRLEMELAARGEELSGMKVELRENREALAVRYDYHNIVGRTPRMLDLFRLLDRLTDTALPVVIQGESGTGKELVARAIHFNGPRRDRPFVSENCAAIPETLLESTLFGYVRGAFTGAERDTRGLYEIAHGGTLFLDEIGEMSPAMQGKLLRVLQQGEFRRVGSEHTRKVDVRIVAATNRDLARMVEEGKFRQDLYFRLNVARIALPALRERREDIPLIVEHFLQRHAKESGGTPKALEPSALARMVAYRWPGNVRELENEIMRAHALSGERITAADLSPAVAAAGDAGTLAPEDPDNLLLKPRVERLERSLIREALGRCGNNQTKAADLLGLSRFGLQKKLKRYRFA